MRDTHLFIGPYALVQSIASCCFSTLVLTLLRQTALGLLPFNWSRGKFVEEGRALKCDMRFATTSGRNLDGSL